VPTAGVTLLQPQADRQRGRTSWPTQSNSKSSGKASMSGNAWRMKQLSTVVDLTGANLALANLSMAHLSGADLNDANLNGTNLSEALLLQTNLGSASFLHADLRNFQRWCLLWVRLVRPRVGSGRFVCLLRSNAAESLRPKTSVSKDGVFLGSSRPTAGGQRRF
jgi:hypothetical protein